jgi:hypothetical protein
MSDLHLELIRGPRYTPTKTDAEVVILAGDNRNEKPTSIDQYRRCVATVIHRNSGQFGENCHGHLFGYQLDVVSDAVVTEFCTA